MLCGCLLGKIYKEYLMLYYMIKKGRLLSVLMFVFSIHFITAYSYGYGRFSLGYFFDIFGAENLFLIGILIGSFALLNWVLSKSIDNKATAGVVSFVIAMFITAGAYFSGFDIEGLLYGIGISEDTLMLLVWLFIIGLFIYLGKKFGFGSVLLFAGGILIAISFTNLVYEKGFVFILGVILGGIGLWRFSKRSKEERRKKQLRQRGVIMVPDDY